MKYPIRKFIYLGIFIVFGLIPMAMFGLAILCGLAFNLIKVAFQ